MVWRHPLIQTSSQSSDLIFFNLNGIIQGDIHSLCKFVLTRNSYIYKSKKILSCWGWQMSLWAALLGRLQVSGPSGGLVLSVSWGFWSIGLVLLVAPTTFHPPQAGSQVIPWSPLPSVHLKSVPLLKSTSYLPHFWSTTITFSDPPSDFTKRKSYNLPEVGFCLKFN